MNKFTNWKPFNPFLLEVSSVFKRFDRRIAARPAYPKVIVLPPSPDFQQPCTEKGIEMKLNALRPEYLKDLRAIFVLSGTRKQLLTWWSNLCFVGLYWGAVRCIFLYAYPSKGWMNLTQLHRFYLDDVLIHEIGHHVDRFRYSNRATKEGFANWFTIGHDRVPASEIVPFTPEQAQPEIHEMRPWAAASANQTPQVQC